MQKVTFYTKLDCPLCDEAYHMLLSLAIDIPMEIDILDINHSHRKSVASYKERIPVIALSGASTELGWPFTSEGVKSYLSQ